MSMMGLNRHRSASYDAKRQELIAQRKKAVREMAAKGVKTKEIARRLMASVRVVQIDRKEDRENVGS